MFWFIQKNHQICQPCNFHSGIFQVVYFSLWYFPGCAISILAFSRVCIFLSGKFKLCIFCNFPGCDFSVIFWGVQFPFWYFQGCAFSTLANFNCAFSVFFKGVIFLSLSWACNLHSGIFQVVHLPFWCFQWCAIEWIMWFS